MLQSGARSKSVGSPVASSHFSPITDFIHACQSAIAFGKKNLQPKMTPSPTRRLQNDTMHFEHIELAQFSRVEFDPTQTGIGHDFVATELQVPTWCDLCGEFIWGLYQSKDNQVCRNCSYTCHQHCSSLVTLNCKTQTTELGNEFFEVQCKRPDSPLFSDSPHGLELRQKIESFNVTAQGYEMELQDDGETFHGFIRVHMNLTRPINVLAGTRPPSIYDIIHEEEDTSEKTLTSFYLPRDTVKALHVTSETTTQEVITALLKKFKVVDNPRKFCLYEKYWAWEGSVKGVLRRMQDDEKPLCLVLAWHIEQLQNRKLVLQENDTGDILWDAFSLPELNNFLRILDREEEEYLNQVRLKYKKIQEKLKEAMDCFEPGASELMPVPNTPEDPYTNM